MNAEEAREATQQSLRPYMVELWIKRIHRMIRRAAGKGKHVLFGPFDGFRFSQPTCYEKVRIWRHLRDQGYEIEMDGIMWNKDETTDTQPPKPTPPTIEVIRDDKTK